MKKLMHALICCWHLRHPQRPAGHRPAERGPQHALLLLAGLLAVQAAHGADAPPGPPPIAAAVAPAGMLDQAQRVALGRRIYFEGLGAAGLPLAAELSSGQPLSGSAAACVSCHRRSGQGGQEGKVLIPPITAPILFRDGVFAPTAESPARERDGVVPRYESRHAYSAASLATALAEGLDPEGRPLVDPMPRYRLDANEQSALLAFLSQLSTQPVGIDAEGVDFWLVLTAGAAPERRATVRKVVEAFAHGLQAPAKPWRLRVFDLAQNPGALDTALRDGSPRPLALLSGAGAGDWADIERVCEREALPCVLPSLAAYPESPLGGRSRIYSQFLSAGLLLEARALAQRVRDDPAPACRHPRVLALADVADAAGSDGLKEALAPIAGAPVVEADAYRAGLQSLLEALPEATRVASAGDADASVEGCVVAWLPQSRLLTLAAQRPPPVGEGRWRAPLGLFGLHLLALPPAWKAKLEFASALDPEAALRLRTVLGPWLAAHPGLGQLDERSAADALAACNLAQAALGTMDAERIRGMRMGEASREEFIEALEHVMNRLRLPAVAHYSPVVLGGVSRMAARSAAILAYPTPTAPEPRLVLRLTPP